VRRDLARAVFVSWLRHALFLRIIVVGSVDDSENAVVLLLSSTSGEMTSFMQLLDGGDVHSVAISKCVLLAAAAPSTLAHCLPQRRKTRGCNL
jgi:hypothetical protein